MCTLRRARLYTVALALLAPQATWPQTALERGLAEAQEGNCRDAVKDLKQVISEGEHSASLFTALAVCQTMLGHSKEATSNFETVVKLDPQAWQSWNNLGSNYLSLGRPKDAGKAFQEAIDREPAAANAWFNLASSRLLEGRRLDGYRALDKAQSLNPHDEQTTRSWLGLAASLAEQAADDIDKGHYEAALEILSTVKRPLAQSASWNNLIGYAEFKLNRTDFAQHHLSAALELDPNNENYVLDVVEFLSARQAYPQASAFLQVGLKRMPDSIPLRFALAVTELLENRRAEATAALENLHASRPELAYVSHALGEAYEAAGNWQGMATLGRALQESGPNDPTGWYLVGVATAQEKAGDPDSLAEAVSALEKAVSLNPNSSRYHMQLGKIYENQKSLAAAIREFEEAIRLHPQDERAHYLLANVYRKTGQTTLATEQLQIHKQIKAEGQQNAYAAMLARTHAMPSNSGRDQ
jgi:Flp pilus assembly protein TadD